MPKNALTRLLKIGRSARQPARSLADVPSRGGSPTARRLGGDHREAGSDLEEWLDAADPGAAMQMLLRYGRLAELFQSATAIGEGRVERYREYDQMADSTLMAAFLEMFVDDVTQQSHESGKTIWPSEDCKYKDQIDDLFTELNIEENCWGWVYSMAKHGDLFLRLLWEPEKGVTRVRDDYHPSEVWRIDVNGKLMGFAYQENLFSSDATYAYGVGIQPAAIVGPEDFVHFMLNYKPHFDKIRVRLPRMLPDEEKHADYTWYEELLDAARPMRDEQLEVLDELEDNDTRAESGVVELIEWVRKNREEGASEFEIEAEDIYGRSVLTEGVGVMIDRDAPEKGDYIYVVVTAKYGSSIMHNARKDYKILNLVEQSLALARLSRSPIARVFYVNTTGASVQERKEMITYVERKFSKNESFDASRALYKDSYVPLGWSDDIVLPVTGDKGDVKVEQIGGAVDVKSIVDIDYFLNKVFSALRTPKSFMGYEEALPGFTAKESLTVLDIRYARSAKKAQRSFINGMKRLCRVHLEAKLNEDVDPDDILLEMVTVSSAEEIERTDIINDRVDMIDKLASMIQEAGGNRQVALKDMLNDLSDTFSLVQLSDKWFEAPPEPVSGGTPEEGVAPGVSSEEAPELPEIPPEPTEFVAPVEGVPGEAVPPEEETL